MIVYGFLSYENGEVRIPNKELMNKFDDMMGLILELKVDHTPEEALEQIKIKIINYVFKGN